MPLKPVEKLSAPWFYVIGQVPLRLGVAITDSPIKNQLTRNYPRQEAGQQSQECPSYKIVIHLSTCSHAAGGALRLEPQDAAKSTVHLVHEGCGRVADRFLKVCLIEGDEGGDVDD